MGGAKAVADLERPAGPKGLRADQTAQFDPVRGVLLIGEQALQELSGTNPTSNPNGDPMITAIAEVANNAVRTVTIERTADGLMAPLLVAWDAVGRAILSEATDDGLLAMRLTSFDLLPSLLMHELRLLRASEPAETGGDVGRQSVIVEAAAVDLLLAAKPADPEAGRSRHEGDPVVGDVRFAWRAVGGWATEKGDTALICLVADSGLWQAKPDDGQMVHLEPVTVAAMATKLGLVVAGKKLSWR